MSELKYTCFQDIANEIEKPAEGTLSKKLHEDDKIKLILFSFSVGEELSEHTSSLAATIHILEGEATLTLGGETMETSSGFWASMEPSLPHSIKAKTAVVMLLTLLK